MMPWPPTDADIRALPAHEHTRLEYKREWYDFSVRQQKAEFIKDVIAMANSTSPDSAGYIVIGIDDEKAGGGVVGVTETPSVERILQTLTSYVNPAPDLQTVNVKFEDKLVSVLKLTWTPSMPHYAIRDFEGVLDTRFVYARRGGTIGVLRPAEIEALIRHKGPRAITPDPLSVGFVGPSAKEWNQGKIVARIVNLTDDPIHEIATLWDIRLPAWPTAFSRARSFLGVELEAGGAIEDSIIASDQYFAGLPESVNVRGGSQAGTRWFDIALRVRFRDRSGFLQQIKKQLSTSA